jgi:arsenite methyltransferase
VGFGETTFGHSRPFGIDDAEMFPLFTPELIALMRRLIPPERQHCMATSVIVRAVRP